MRSPRGSSDKYSPSPLGRPTRIEPEPMPPAENGETPAAARPPAVATGGGSEGSSSDSPLPLAHASAAPSPGPATAPSPAPSFLASPSFMQRKKLEMYATREARLAKFRERHGAEASSMQDHAERIRRQLNLINRDKRFVVRPGKTRWLVAWDAVSTCALIYTAIFTPFEAAFVSPALGPASWTDAWFLVNRMLDVIFTVDMCLQFFVAYQRADVRGGEVWVESHTLVIRHYVTTWFPLDCSTIVIPAIFDFYLASPQFGEAELAAGKRAAAGAARRLSEAVGVAAGAGPGPGPGAPSAATEVGFAANMQILRTLRVLRLIKLVRLVRASRVFERWKSKITISYASSVVLQCIFTLILGAHWCDPHPPPPGPTPWRRPAPTPLPPGDGPRPRYPPPLGDGPRPRYAV